jgi:DNA-binding transcriptional MerR regulator
MLGVLKIGDFSQLGRVSVRMLRHYDATDLLKPAEVDHLSGYRFCRSGALRTPLHSI